MKPNRYTKVIDLTSGTRRQEAQEAQEALLREPEPPLPPATMETLPETLQAAARAASWPSLMAVQERALPYILDGRDLIVQSRTGSGKTGAFLLPLFNVLDAEESAAQALILTPTRELALQVQQEFEILRQGSEDTRALRSVAVYGGVGYKKQIKGFKDGVQVVIGTPGRVLDHLQRKTLRLDALRVLILDEADEMLSMGFFPAMRQLKRYLPDKRQSYMFSATMPYRVRQLGESFLYNPGFLSLSVGQVHVDTMAHGYYLIPPMEKDDVLRRLIELQNPDSAIIFSNTKKKVDYLAQMLQNFGYDAQPITGDLNQRARERVMQKIRDGNLRLLVATDVAARGIDISDLSHVFMYDVPQDPEYYIHRAGRTARAGKTGAALTLATLMDRASLLAIAKRYDIDLEEREIPTEEDVEERVAERAVSLLEDALRNRSADERGHIEAYHEAAEHLIREDRSALLALLIDAFYHAHLHLPDDPQPPQKRKRDDRTAEPSTVEDLTQRLETELEKKRNLQRNRLRRFVPLVEQASEEEEGEPELLALLLHDFDNGILLLESDQKTPKPEEKQNSRNRSNRRQGKRRR